MARLRPESRKTQGAPLRASSDSAHGRTSLIVMSPLFPESGTMVEWASVRFFSIFYSASRLERVL